MTEPDHLAHLAVEVATIDALLADADLAAAVPDCPNWALRDLVRHLGGVHRWVTAVVLTGDKQPQVDHPVEDGELRAWFADGAGVLQDALAGDPDRAVWTMGGAQTVRFWRRRQAVETAVHRVDAQRCAGVESGIPDDLAESGIDEVVELIHPRQVRLGRTPAPTCSARLVSTSGPSWLLGDGPTCATVTGPPAALLLLLWRRERRRSSAFTVEGDMAALDVLLAAGLTP